MQHNVSTNGSITVVDRFGNILIISSLRTDGILVVNKTPGATTHVDKEDKNKLLLGGAQGIQRWRDFALLIKPPV